ncbi:MAG: response regulator, partial [Deltaproteobacteria bacterium]|nr:response regulator [Deltaproteobacteria bacterium]
MKRKIGTAIVVGAGISGIRSALDLAEAGYGVTLTDREPHMGGILSQLDYQFPTDRCGMCKMLPLVNRDASSQYCLRKGLFHENIDILLSTQVTSIEGEPGNFKVTLRQKPESVNPDLCMGCGECVAVCPVDVPDAFNENLAKRKAIYLPVPHNIPNTYTIDFVACTRCGACVEACPTGAIKLPEEERKKFRIMIVDDELIVRDSLKEWLEDEGFSVDMAGSGQEALTLLSKQSYHIMLTDIKMPGMDGMEVLKNAKKDFPDLCIVMMTAYATVETAVEAMKVGALDYLLKPFDPEVFTSKILQIYEALEVSTERQLEVGAVVFSGGVSYFDPSGGKNTYGYGTYPDVLTSLEFERLISGTGPSQGNLIRPSDGKPIKKIAWLQCVGSRDLQTDADFCSSICCMYAVKEARLAKEKTGGDVEATIFYMDMRAFEKSFQRYCDQAEDDLGISFKRGRIHSVEEDKTNNDIKIRYADFMGECHEERFDMVVLSVGQRPSPGTESFAKSVDIPLNQWGFCQSEPFSSVLTHREGILLGGSSSGLKDISESIIQASSAALCASRVIHSSGGSLALEPESTIAYRDVSQEMPKVLIAICACGETLAELFDKEKLVKHLKTDPGVSEIVFRDKECVAEGWDAILKNLEKSSSNRMLIGACLPYVYVKKIRELSHQTGLDSAFIDVVDIRTQLVSVSDKENAGNVVENIIKMGLARVKRADSSPTPTVNVIQKALVIGGGIAGMTAALSIADHGFGVDLLEQEDRLGGNLNWLQDTLEGHNLKTLLDEKVSMVEKHPLITIHTKTSVINTSGEAGKFSAILKNHEEENPYTLEHGVVILSTG